MRHRAYISCIGTRGKPVRWFIIGATFAMLVLVSENAWAHAILVGSSPREGDFVTGPDVTSVLSFNSRIDQSRSRLSLDGPGLSGYPIPLSKNDTEPAKLIASLHHLNAGTYTMHWQVLAADGHITRGTISFRVK